MADQLKQLKAALAGHHDVARLLRSDTPRALADAIDRGLAKEPADRWPTAAAMRAALTG